MENFLVGNLFLTSVYLYILAAVGSLILIGRHKLCNILTNSICIAASVLLGAASMMKILSGSDPIKFDVFKSAIPFLSINARIDNLAAFFLLSLSILVCCVSIYSIGYISHYIGKRNVGLFNFLYAAFVLSMIFVFVSANAVFFYISWEAMALLSYFLVIFESEHTEYRKAGILYLIMTHIATAFLLTGFMMIYSYTGSFDLFGSSAAIPEAAKNVIFILLLIGFGTKAGVIPFHIWLPHAYHAAPSNVSALMSGIMTKTAIYGILRFIFSYLGIQNTWWGVMLLTMGISSCVLGVAYAFAQTNIKRVLAYSSIENIGIVFIGLGIGFIAYAQNNVTVSALAIIAALFHSFNHTLFKGSLFLGAGSIHFAAHTKNMEELGGLIKKMPITALFVLCDALSISALVPFNGFISEWLTYQSIFANIVPGQAGLNILSIVSVAALGLSGALAVACYVKLFGISFLGRPRSEKAFHAKEVPASMNIAVGILSVLCLVAGLLPLAVLRLLDTVTLGLTGISVFGQFQGGPLLAYYPLKIAQNSISPSVVLIAFLAIILLCLITLRLMGGKYIERKYGTWDCGFEALNARMQYSATGFSKPIQIVFKIVFRPTRKIKVEGDLLYHPQSIGYETTFISVFEKFIYHPFYKIVKMLSKRIKFYVQTGSTHSYLIYIFVAVLALMAYNRFA